MKLFKLSVGTLTVLFTFTVLLLSCNKDEETVIPTKSSMEGIWAVTEAFNENGDTILNKIAFPISAFHLSSDHTMISTAGPMFMYIVYGGNKYTTIASKIDQVFNYASLDFNGGEWFIAGGEVDRFTVEMKLEGLPGQKAITELLGLLGIGSGYLDVVIYHKFKNVKITFPDKDRNKMTWEFDNLTTAVYNTKDQFGSYVLWEGWPIDKFSRARFVFTKQVKDLKTVVQDAI